MNELANQQAPLRSIELFAGAGGGILAGQIHGWRTVCAVESDPYAASVLVQRQEDEALDPFPIWDSVETFTGEVLDPFRGVDIVAGGFPCTDIAVCGKGEGIEGKESGMFKHMARIIDEVRPRVGVWIENSPMLAMGRGLGTVLCSLQEMGYDEIKWGVVGARSTGAPHRRDRIWIWAVANSSSAGAGHNDCSAGNQDRASSGEPLPPLRQEDGETCPDRADAAGSSLADSDSERLQSRDTRREVAVDADSCSKERMSDEKAIRGEEAEDVPDANGARLERRPRDEPDEHQSRRLSEEEGRPASQKALRRGMHWWAIEPGMGGVADGLADRLDIHGTPEPGSVPRLAQGIRHRVDRIKCIGNGQVPDCSALALEILTRENE